MLLDSMSYLGLLTAAVLLERHRYFRWAVIAIIPFQLYEVARASSLALNDLLLTAARTGMVWQLDAAPTGFYLARNAVYFLCVIRLMHRARARVTIGVYLLYFVFDFLFYMWVSQENWTVREGTVPFMLFKLLSGILEGAPIVAGFLGALVTLRILRQRAVLCQ